MACNSDNNVQRNNEVDITACGTHNPVWLINKIDSIQNSGSGKFRAVRVYTVNLDKQEYIAIWDMMNSSVVNAHLFYTCSGESINFQNPLYNTLMTLFDDKDENYVLLWSN
jgi:hypothetical protein